MKPRITILSSYWICAGGGASGIGASPAAAYRQWVLNGGSHG